MQTAVVARRGNLRNGYAQMGGGGGKWFATLIADERDVQHGTAHTVILKSEIDVILDMAMSHDWHDTTDREIGQ